jgi:hypothetical protein
MSDFRTQGTTNTVQVDSLEVLQCLSLLFYFQLQETSAGFPRWPDPIPSLLVDPVLNWICSSIINPWA